MIPKISTKTFLLAFYVTGWAFQTKRARVIRSRLDEIRIYSRCFFHLLSPFPVDGEITGSKGDASEGRRLLADESMLRLVIVRAL